jgi:hypothetical protein
MDFSNILSPVLVPDTWIPNTIAANLDVSTTYGFKKETNGLTAGQKLFFNKTNVTVPIPNHSHTLNNSGGTESRPNNINLWTYVRIN